MSRAKRIVRLTFWLNNLLFMALVGFALVFTGYLPRVVLPGAVGLLIGSCIGLWWGLSHHFHVKKLWGLYWVADERDQAIALKVHSTIMTVYMYYLYGLFFALLTLTATHHAVNLPRMLMLVWLMLVSSNALYYWLWCKYDLA